MVAKNLARQCWSKFSSKLVYKTLHTWAFWSIYFWLREFCSFLLYVCCPLLPLSYFSILGGAHNFYTPVCTNFKSRCMWDRQRGKSGYTLQWKLGCLTSLLVISKIIWVLFHISISNEFPWKKQSLLSLYRI